MTLKCSFYTTTQLQHLAAVSSLKKESVRCTRASPLVNPGLVTDPWGGSRLRPVINDHTVELTQRAGLFMGGNSQSDNVFISAVGITHVSPAESRLRFT